MIRNDELNVLVLTDAIAKGNEGRYFGSAAGTRIDLNPDEGEMKRTLNKILEGKI